MLGDGPGAGACPELVCGDNSCSRLIGDFYCEPDDVCRRASLAVPFEFAHLAPRAEFDGFDDLLFKDFGTGFDEAGTSYQGPAVLGRLIKPTPWSSEEKPPHTGSELTHPAQPGLEGLDATVSGTEKVDVG